MNILVSACLLGVNCKYDGADNLDQAIKDQINHDSLIPVCPEQLGGMETPRQPSERVGDRVLSKTGEDVTHHFLKGAKETLELAKLYKCEYAILKERSPSCGYGEIYDGTFTGSLTLGNGVTAELLIKNNIRVLGESKAKELFTKLNKS